MSARQLHLNLFLLDTGHHEASWRLPGSDPHANLSLAAPQHLARVAEEAKFDSLFLADSPAMFGEPGRRPSARLEPTALLSALAVSTQHIGLIAATRSSSTGPGATGSQWGPSGSTGSCRGSRSSPI